MLRDRHPDVEVVVAGGPVVGKEAYFASLAARAAASWFTSVDATRHGGVFRLRGFDHQPRDALAGEFLQ